MRRAVFGSPAAARDLAQIREWLMQPGAGRRATRRLSAIAFAIRGLAAHPTRYPARDHVGIREWPVEGHRIMYRVVPDDGDEHTGSRIEVVRVFGPGQNRDL